jgi:hypothetical protein
MVRDTVILIAGIHPFCYSSISQNNTQQKENVILKSFSLKKKELENLNPTTNPQSRRK